MDCIGRTIPLFGHDEFCNVLLIVRQAVPFLGSLVLLRPVNESNHVGVLLQRA